MPLTCRIELKKDKGVTLTVEDEASHTSQTVVLDGTSIVLTCRDGQSTSTITQKSESIAVRCKAFSVDAETVRVTSKKDMSYESEAQLSLSGKRDLSIATDANLSARARQELKLAGAAIAATADRKATLAAATVSVKGTEKAELRGAGVEVGADMRLDLKGTAIKVASNGTLEVGGQVSTLKGQMVNVQGSLVKLG